MTRKILTQAELDQIEKHLISRDHKRFFAIARYTGQKFGTISNLKVADVYTESKQPLANIHFSGIKSGNHDFIMFDKLESQLISYIPEKFIYDAWLFPSAKFKEKSITFSASFRWLKTASKKADLQDLQISTNTIRQSFISHLYELGFNQSLIKEIVGLNKLSTLPIDTSNEPTRLCEMLQKIFG